MRRELEAIFGAEVSEDVAAHAGDMTENEPRRPAFFVEATEPGQVGALLELASGRGVPVTPKVTGQNVGGLAIPAEGGIVLGLAKLAKIEIDPAHMVAWIEPGVSWQQLKDEAAKHDLVLGFPLAPPDASVLACALMDGLSSMAVSHGSFGDWVHGVVAYLADGTRVVTGSAALSGQPLSRGPLPDLTGMFLNWFGTTGVVVRLGLALWPKRRFRRRDVVAFRTAEAGIGLIRAAAPTGLFDDLGGIGWPAAKWALGLDRLGARDPAEPELYVIADYASDTRAGMDRRRAWLEARADVVGVDELVRLAPDLSAFADLPTRLGFLLDHEGGGLTWVGTYGPMDGRLEEGARKGIAMLEDAGHPPLAVIRPMKGGHFGVLRFIERFDRNDAVATAAVRDLNVAVGRMLMDLGFVPYKCPAILYEELYRRLDPGFVAMMERLRTALDPHGILSPDRWRNPSVSSGAAQSPREGEA